ncbi:MAG: 30S ribosome-binding factor RbfA [Actinobacteria bacterium]|nr:30S ribosome-binding factor RbfA [Actinomycetota bacterium]
MLRVNSILHHLLAEEIERLADTRLELVTVTGVDTSPDLRHAVVYVDVLGQDEHGSALEALGRASHRLQAAVGRQVRLKYTPSLEFRLDPAIATGERIEAILRDLSEEE